MLCQNCGENEANIRYTKIVNGVKKEMALCEECSNKLGITSIDFNLPINLSSFLCEFFNEEENFLPSFINTEKLVCNECGMTYEEFVDTGKFGCGNCYNIFSKKIDPILKNIHTGSTHVGRKGKINTTHTSLKKEALTQDNIKENNELEKLKQNLKLAIKEERYEDAAKIRDEIKKWGV